MLLLLLLVMCRYPTHLTLPDERVMIVGGYFSLMADYNTHTEIFLPQAPQGQKVVDIPINSFADATKW